MGLDKENIMVHLEKDGENNFKLLNTHQNCSKLFNLEDLDSLNMNLNNITILELRNCNITNIPNTVQKLNLKQLVLCHNRLGEVPSCLYTGLNSLQVLDLSHNFLKEFDVEPACHLEIVKLNISYNKIRTLPHWILTTHCPKLQELYYSDNFLINLNTSRQLNIKRLEMRNTQLMDVDFPFLKKLATLEFLDISNESSNERDNRFKEIEKLFSKLKWKNMQILKLNNLILSIIPKELFYIVSLKELHLVNCDLNWIPEEVEYLVNLELLDISNNAICSLSKLTTLEKLTTVIAPFNYISVIGEFRNDLDLLDLYNNQLESFAPSVFNIKLIDLEKNLFDTSHLKTFQIYQNRRNEFREKFNLNRVDGPIELPETPDPSDEEDSRSSDEVYESTPDNCYNLETENECWDEEERDRVKKAQINPHITPSDDEWNGKIEVRLNQKKKIYSAYDPDEDWIFCDVDL